MPTPGTGTGPGFDSPLPATGANVNAQGQIVDVPLPDTGTATDAQQVTAEWDNAIKSAQAQYDQAKAAYDQAQQAYDAAQAQGGILDGGAAIRAAQSRLDNANTNWQRSGNILERAQAGAATAVQRFRESRYASPQEQDLLTKQASYYDAQAQRTQAEAKQLNAVNPKDKQDAEIALSNANKALADAQTTLATAQADRTKALTGSEVSLTGAQANQAQGSANLANATAAATPAQTAADVGLKGSQAQQAAAAAAASNATVESSKQGTLYGLNEWINAQRDAIAKGLISPEQADAALTARIAGTDVYHATQDAEKATMARTQAALDQRTQDTSLVNNARTNLGSLGGSVFSTISSNAARAPHGSGAALAGGYGAMMSDFTNRLGGPTAFQPPAAVPTPPLPPMLQPYAGGPQQPPAPSPMPPGAPPMPPPQAPAPPPVAAPSPDAGAGPGHTINITIGGSGSGPTNQPPPGFNGGGDLLQGYARGTSFAPGGPAIVGERGPEMVNLPRGAQVVPNGAMPAFLQGKMPATRQHVIAAHPEAARRAGYV